MKGLSLLLPYALMQIGMNANKGTDVLHGKYGQFFGSCVLWSVGFLQLAWFLLKKRDVRA